MMFGFLKKKKMPAQGIDRRKFARLSAHHLLRYRVIGLEYKVLGNDAESILTYAKNISAGGILFYAKQSIPVDTMIELSIIFPFYEQPIKAVATVRRFRELQKTGGFDVGAEFVNIEDNAREFINKKILKVLEESNEKDKK